MLAPIVSALLTEESMRRTLMIAAAVVATAAIIAVWATASIRNDAASKLLGPTAIETHMDVHELMKRPGDLPVERYAAY
jgi:hypothetical protein